MTRNRKAFITGIKSLKLSNNEKMFLKKLDDLTKTKSLLTQIKISPQEAKEYQVSVKKDGKKRTALELLSFPGVRVDNFLSGSPELSCVSDESKRQVERDALYANYVERQARDAETLKRDEVLLIPANLDYSKITGLSNEAKAKLSKVRPENIGQASRIDGITPAALTLVIANLRLRHAS